jgi:hypothetical protein
VIWWVCGAAVLVALVVLGIVGYDLFGRLRRLGAAVAEVEQQLIPRVQQLSARLNTAEAAESTPGGPGRHRADP